MNHARLLATGLILASALLATSLVHGTGSPSSNTRPLSPEYQFNSDGSVTLRVCYNSSCGRTEVMKFTAEDLAEVVRQVRVCPGIQLYDRLQRLRIAIWQMEVVARKYQPLLANDRAVNDQEYGVDGRTDCVDNATNTTTFLQILSDAGELTGWSVAAPRVRMLFDFNNVHWTAVVIDQASREQWAVDSWFQPHGQLPFVLPLEEWLREKRGWEPPLDVLNPYPRNSYELCRATQ